MKEIELYLKALKSGNKSPNTIVKYSGNLNKFEKYFNLETVDDIKKITVQDYYDFYNAQNFKKENSTNDLIRSLSAFFSWMEILELISRQENAFRKVRFGGRSKFLKVPDEEIEVLSDGELEKLIKSGRTLQERFMICLMAFNGFRRGTVTEIKLTDIHNCSIDVTGKGKVKRQVSLHETVCAMLSLYLAQRKSDSEYLFFPERGETNDKNQLGGASVNNRIKAAGKRAGFSEDKIKKLHAHLLRHTFGTNIIKEHGIEIAQQALWHKSKMTTVRYDHSGLYLSNQALLNQRNLNVSEK